MHVHTHRVMWLINVCRGHQNSAGSHQALGIQEMALPVQRSPNQPIAAHSCSHCVQWPEATHFLVVFEYLRRWQGKAGDWPTVPMINVSYAFI